MITAMTVQPLFKGRPTGHIVMSDITTGPMLDTMSIGKAVEKAIGLIREQGHDAQDPRWSFHIDFHKV